MLLSVFASRHSSHMNAGKRILLRSTGAIERKIDRKVFALPRNSYSSATCTATGPPSSCPRVLPLLSFTERACCAQQRRRVNHEPGAPIPTALPMPAHSRHAALPLITAFRINTCKTPTIQMTLTAIRINTYAKPGGGGVVNALAGSQLWLSRLRPWKH